jgi:hypothetical protein
MEGMVPIPNPQLARAPFSRIGGKAKAGQQLGEHGIAIGGFSANEGTHSNAVAPFPGKSPAKAMAHQAKFEESRSWFGHGALQIHRNGGGKPRFGRPKPQLRCQRGAGSIGNHHSPAAVIAGFASNEPMASLAIGRNNCEALDKSGARPLGLLHQVAIEHGAAHNPKGGVPWQDRRDGVLQAPAKTHLFDHGVNGRAQIEGKEPLHGRSHASTTGFAAGEELLFQHYHRSTTLGEVEGGGSASSAAADNDHITARGVRF